MKMSNIVPIRKKEGLGRRLFEEPEHFMRRFEDMFEDFFESMHFPESWTEKHGGFSPRIDVNDKENEIDIIAELPGLNQEDVKLTLTDNQLIIEGEKKSEFKEEKEGLQHIERSFGKFRRTIPVNEVIDQDNISADFANGILTIKMPKNVEVQKGRVIEIKSKQ